MGGMGMGATEMLAWTIVTLETILIAGMIFFPALGDWMRQGRKKKGGGR